MVTKRLYILLSLIVCFGIIPAKAQTMFTQLFDPNFKTLKIAPVSNSYFPPIWVMGQEDNPLEVSFDNINEDHQFLRYSLIHCNSDWTPSALLESEYTNGFNYCDIEDYEFSSSTFTHFVHYRFQIPNENMQILRSGNYIVKVYPQDNPDNVVLQARFSVCENLMSVYPSVTSRTDVDYNEHHQQVAVKISCKGNEIRDPYNDLKLVVTQNGRLDNEVVLTKPLMVNGNTITFEHDKRLIFAAGNEFRRIETVAINSPAMGVVGMQYFEPYYHATLRTDVARANEAYYYDSTQHGYFTIRNWESTSSDTEADYVVTHFTLDTEGPLAGGKIYLDGEFTRHQYTPENLMKYDMATGLYTADILLKQGAYNYQYLWVPDNSNKGYTSKIEGDKYQTVNEYVVKLYHRQPGDRYDRLIGFGITFSGK